MPHRTGAFAGTGGFTVSPVHGTTSTASRQFQARLSVTGQGASPPRDPGHSGHTATYAIVTPRPFSTSTGPGAVPHLTGAFAGTGGFTVSPVHGTTSTASRQFQARLSVTAGQGASPPRDPGHGAGHTATYAIVTPGPFSTSTGPSAVPHLTGAFAGTGGFTVSPVHGTTSTASRQFQARLSVTGQGAPQNTAVFVMTSQIPNAPNIGFTQVGWFHAVTMHNTAAWHGLAGGAVSSATPTSPLNTVPTANGTPVTGFTLNNPIKTGPRTTMANSHPTLFLNGYVGRVMVTAVPSPTSFATPANSPLIGNGGGGISASAGSFFQGGPSKTTPLYGVIGGSLILNGTGGYLGSGIFAPRKP